ncbi:MAG: DUF4339 domain-containing protein [Gemmataceae bacterium]|nr:DUF4339 domain-containing protein [Gemmataceae bacterium]
MAAEWFYTTNKQQMGPVSWDELRQLANNGMLKSNDMIWSEGMDEWIKAFKQKGLFLDDHDNASDDDDVPRSMKSSLAKPPKSRRSTRDDEDDIDDEEDKSKTRRNRRQQEENSAKSKVGLKIGLIIGGVVCFLLFLACAGGVIAFVTLGAGGGVPGKRVHTFTERNIQATRVSNPKQYHFKQGTRLVLTAVNQTQMPQTDVNLLVYHGNDPNPRWIDVRLPNEDRNCRIEFVVPVTGFYRIAVHNVGPGMATRSDVRIEEH